MNERSPSVASDLQELDLLERRLGLQAVPPTEISSLTRLLAGAKSRIALKAINNILKKLYYFTGSQCSDLSRDVRCEICSPGISGAQLHSELFVICKDGIRELQIRDPSKV